MKICITSQQDNLDSLVDPRFGRCRYFIIYDTESDTFQSFSNPNVISPSGAGISSAQFVVDKGVEVVLTGNVGPNAFGVFQAAGVKVMVGLAGLRVKEAIEKFKKGELVAQGDPKVFSHFGMMGQGFGNFSWPGFMPGFGIGGGLGMGRGRLSQQGYFQTSGKSSISKEQELQFLKQQVDFLKQQIEIINRRIQELEKG